MLTDTPLDLTSFGPLLSLLGIGYWLLALGLVAVALWLPKRWQIKVPLAALILAGFICPIWNRVETGQAQRDESKAQLDTAMALFAERCKTAGEKITRTVDNVDGVVLMKWRPTEVNLSDQFRLNDPYGHDCYGDECIKRLLRVTGGAHLNPEDANQHTRGYRFVETVDPGDRLRYRYIGVMKLHPRWTDQAIAREKELTGKSLGPSAYPFTLERELIEKFSARYGITWDDISTSKDRGRWIAGSSLKAVDLQTDELLAERIGYLIDKAQGSREGFRSPWPLAQATACPPPTSDRTTWAFAMKIISPSKGGE